MAAAAGSEGASIELKMAGDIPIVDLNAFLNAEEGEEAAEKARAECDRVAESLHKYGILVARDPRVTEDDNNQFLDMLERYFEQDEDVLREDVRADLSYQVGATPSGTELPRDHCERMKVYKDADAPLSECPPEKDCKWRFFWRIGDRPKETKFGELNAEPVTPKEFPEWTETMNKWGSKLLDCGRTIAEMAAIGFGLESDALTSMMDAAPHLLAPTATDFSKFGKLGTVCAGFHQDLNAFTVHGKSRFPGLYIWTRDGKKVAVKVPDGCLLVQAGMQAEYATGGHVLAGFHEVVVQPKTIEAIEAATKAKRSLWRISSTCFTHFASDKTLEPLGKFAEMEGVKEKYPAMKVGEQVKRELEAINLGAAKAEGKEEEADAKTDS